MTRFRHIRVNQQPVATLASTSEENGVKFALARCNTAKDQFSKKMGRVISEGRLKKKAWKCANFHSQHFIESFFEDNYPVVVPEDRVPDFLTAVETLLALSKRWETHRALWDTSIALDSLRRGSSV